MKIVLISFFFIGIIMIIIGYYKDQIEGKEKKIRHKMNS